MKRLFWIKGTTPRDTLRIKFSLFFSVIVDIAMWILVILCAFGSSYVFFYRIPKKIMDAGKEVSAVSEKRKTEQDECFKMDYAGMKFYRYTLEGHEYWCVENFKNNVGFFHSESCPCKTNKVEVVQ